MNRSLWQKRISTRRADLGAILVILTVFLVFFAPVLFGGKIFVTNDSFVYSYPLRAHAWAQIRNGSLPLWTPLLMSGYPLLSMAQLGIGYPLTWGYLFLPNYLAEEIYVMAPFLLGPIFMYAWIRVSGRSRLAALFAALAFGYGGMMFSPIAHNGMLTNTFMWTPLILIAIERARSKPFARCFFWATAAYAMCALTGIGQGVVTVTILTLVYAAFVGLAANHLASNESLGWLTWARWRPLAVALGAVALGSGIAAFQILETVSAQRLSIRRVLSYETFSEGAFSPLKGLKSMLAPLYYQSDVTTYMVPLALILALPALADFVFGRSPRDLRIIFWLVVAVLAWIFILGPNTPLYRYIYLIPILNKFRVPSRHAFEWTFAVAVLSAYGWDIISDYWAARAKNSAAHLQKIRLLGGWLALALAVVVALVWWLSNHEITGNVTESQLLNQYLRWKTLFALLALIGIWQAWRLVSVTRRTVLLAAAIALVCFFEPALAASYWWWPKAKTADRFQAEAIATRFLKEKNPQHDRIYTHTSIWAEEYMRAPRIDPPNLSAVQGLRDVGGYEPLFPERYSRALGNVTNDGVYPRPGYAFDDTIFAASSHVLDLLNTRFAIAYANLSTIPDNLHEKDGVRFFRYDSYFVVKPGERKRLNAANRECDAVALVTALGHSAATQQGTVVAKLHFRAADGRVIERELRAGVDSSEWSIERPEIAATMQHEKATVFDSHPADDGNFPSYRFWSLSRLNQRVRLDAVEIENVSSIVEVQVWKTSLYDSASQRSYPLPHYDEDKWRTVYDANNVLIIENQRPMPRAWLVAEAEAVSGEESLRRIRGESEKPFDPRRTALLEVLPEQLPQLPGGPIAANARAQLVAETPRHLSIDTTTDKQSLLVVSESNYPGWEATVDGARVPIYTTDFLLRGVAVPPGTHRVEMLYAAPAARNGAVISVVALGAALALGLYSRRRQAKENSAVEAVNSSHSKPVSTG
ncbi:MAG: hypothetical protein JWM21_1291 [Acidobacteria bacterium]|nr:hypothetical protein [Acidobacteriota bacterium]